MPENCQFAHVSVHVWGKKPRNLAQLPPSMLNEIVRKRLTYLTYPAHPQCNAQKHKKENAEEENISQSCQLAIICVSAQNPSPNPSSM